MLAYLPAALLVAVVSAIDTSDTLVFEGSGATLRDENGSELASSKHRYTFTKSEKNDNPGILVNQEAHFNFNNGEFESAGHSAGIASCIHGLSEKYQYQCFDYSFGPNNTFYISISQTDSPVFPNSVPSLGFRNGS